MKLHDYILKHTEPEPLYLKLLSRRTNLRLVNPRMESGHYQGRLLKMIVKMLNPNRVLEIGTFSGYATLCIAEGLNHNAHIDTIEIDDELEDFIRENFEKSGLQSKITLHIGDAINILDKIDSSYDLAFIDADKRLYKNYFNKILPKINSGGFILADNTLWNGKVVDQIKSNDFQTQAICEFNDFIAEYSGVEQIILPVRDGITIIRKK